MKNRVALPLVGLAVLVVLVVVLTVFGGSGGDSAEHRADSDGAHGTSALRQQAEALGHPTRLLEDSFDPGDASLLFVFSPTEPFTPADLRRLDGYVRGGGVLVYGAERGDLGLDNHLGVHRLQVPVAGTAAALEPALRGVYNVQGSATAQALQPSPDQVVLLRSHGNAPLAVEERYGQGMVVVLTDPLPLCNGFLDQADNGRLASDLISMAGPAGHVAFDEYHHLGQGLPPSPLDQPLATPWGAAIAWAVVAGFVGLLLRGRAFGPRRALPGGGDRSSVEHLAAVGRLLRRARARDATLERLREAARRSLAVRYGIAPGQALDRALVERMPARAAELAEAEAAARAAVSEAEVLEAARRLHHLAHPVSATGTAGKEGV